LTDLLALGSSPYGPDAPMPYIGIHTAHRIYTNRCQLVLEAADHHVALT